MGTAKLGEFLFNEISRDANPPIKRPDFNAVLSFKVRITWLVYPISPTQRNNTTISTFLIRLLAAAPD